MLDIHITVDDKDVLVKVEKKRRKTLVLKVLPDSGRVLLSVPLNTPAEYARSFVRKNIAWLKKQLEIVVPDKKKYSFSAGEIFYYQGRPLTLFLRIGQSERVTVEGGALVLWQKEELLPAARQKAIDGFFRREAQLLCRDALLRMFEHFCLLLKIDFIPVLKVRRMSSRWGSCRPLRRAVSLNSYLVHMPPECLDYVAAHELCHFYRSDHSAAFWQMLALGMPDWRKRKKLLNDAALYMLYQ